MKRPIFLSDVYQIGGSRQIFIKVPNIKFHGNPSSGSHADICGQTDGHDEANRRFSRLWERAKKTVFNSVTVVTHFIYYNNINI